MKLKLYLFGVFMLHSDSSQTAFEEKANEQIMQNKLNLTLEKKKKDFIYSSSLTKLDD